MKRRKPRDRKGAVTVEFAFIAPLFVTMFVGLTQVCYLLQCQNQFAMAAREGARSAVHERNNSSGDGTSTNERVEQDVRRFLNASGLPGDDVNVIIADADAQDIAFDLDDPANEFENFQLIIEYPVNELLSAAPPGSDEFNISARVVFRNGQVE